MLRKLSIMFLLFAFLFPLYSEPVATSNTQVQESPWMNVWDGLDLLEKEQNFMLQKQIEQQRQIESLTLLSEKQELQIGKLEIAYKDKALLCQDLETNCEKLKQSTTKWKNCSIVLGVVLIVVTPITIGVVIKNAGGYRNLE